MTPSIAEDIRQYLLQMCNPHGGVWFREIPPGTYVKMGAIVITVLSINYPIALSGPVPLYETVLQIDCWAERATEVVALANSVQAQLAVYPPPTISTNQIQVSFIRNIRDIPEPDLELSRRSMELTVIHLEA